MLTSFLVSFEESARSSVDFLSLLFYYYENVTNLIDKLTIVKMLLFIKRLDGIRFRSKKT